MRRSQIGSSVDNQRQGSAGRLSPVLPLATGERLTRREFERRYAAHPDIKKAELVEGVTQVREPVRAYAHGRPHSAMSGILVAYAAYTPGVSAVVDATVRLDKSNELQPDAALFVESGAGGQSHVDEDGYITGAPELVVEIAASSAARDLQRKFHAYWRNGVREYVVWRTLDKRVDWFALTDGQYEAVAPDGKGLIHSNVFPGLRLDVGALLANHVAGALEVLHAGIGSPRHEAFVARLKNEMTPDALSAGENG